MCPVLFSNQKSNQMERKSLIKKDDRPVLRKKFAGHGAFKGKSFTVLAYTDNAYFLEVIQKQMKLHAFMVIDNQWIEKFPEKESDLQWLNVFRTSSRSDAEKEYQNRNQIKIS